MPMEKGAEKETQSIESGCISCRHSGKRTHVPRSGGADAVRRARGAGGLFCGATLPVLHRDNHAQSRRTDEEWTLTTVSCSSATQRTIQSAALLWVLGL